MFENQVEAVFFLGHSELAANLGGDFGVEPDVFEFALYRGFTQEVVLAEMLKKLAGA